MPDLTEMRTPEQLRALTNQALIAKDQEKLQKERAAALKEKEEVDLKVQKLINMLPRLTITSANEGKDNVIIITLAQSDIEEAPEQFYISPKSLDAHAALQVQQICENLGFRTKIDRLNNWFNLVIHW